MIIDTKHLFSIREYANQHAVRLSESALYVKHRKGKLEGAILLGEMRFIYDESKTNKNNK